MDRQVERVAGERPGLLAVLGPDYAHGAELARRFRASGAEYRPQSAVWQVTPGRQVWLSRDGRSERHEADTAAFITSALGFRVLGRENGWTRYGFDSAPGVVDIKETPHERRGAWGVGAVHHLAWAVKDLDEELLVRAQVAAAGGRATDVIDRFWFKSVYFKEPGGVLFEIATEGPGFAVDEDPAHLGETLVLPPWFEPARAEIARALPVLTPPSPRLGSGRE